MKIDRILETCLYVDDLAAAEKFYQRILNVEPFSRVKHRHVFFRFGESMLLLFNPIETAKAVGNVPTHGAHGPGHVAFAITRDQIELCRRLLQENGIAIEAEITWPSGGQSIYFRDPAGNSVEFATVQVWG